MARGGRARGHNGFGQLGVGDTADRGLPTPVGNATWKTLAAGGYHTCGIQTDSSLWCWGGNGRGQLGDGTADPRLLPTRIGSGSAWTDVTLGFGHTCARQADGSVWCWGNNDEGELADGTAWTTTFAELP